MKRSRNYYVGRTWWGSGLIRGFSLLLLSAVLCGVAQAGEVAQYGGTFSGWPQTWYPVNSLNDPANDTTDESKPHLNFVGDATYPCVYIAIGSYGGADYLFFRVRVKYDGDLGPTPVPTSPFKDGTIMILIDYDGDSHLEYAFGWDFKENTYTEHGLEMLYLKEDHTSTAPWGGIRMDDVDGNNAKKIAPPDFGFSNGDGYIRTIDHQGTGASFGDTTFIDFAIKCNYLQNSSTTALRCLQEWKIQVGSIANANDHGWINYDVAGGASPTSIIATSWSQPTSAVVSKFQAHGIGGATVLTWETSSEVMTAGFNVYALDSAAGERRKVNGELIPALFESPTGGAYFLEDERASGDGTVYELEEVELDGSVRSHGRARAVLGFQEGELPLPGVMNGEGNANSMRVPHMQERMLPESRPIQSDPCAMGAERLKIGVDRAGLYRLGAAEIASAMCMREKTVKALIASGNFRLTSGGRPIAFSRAAGSEEIYFYGEPPQSRYTDTNVYWLSRGRGSLMPTMRLKPPQNEPAGSVFTDYLHAERDLVNAPIWIDDPEEDFWVWKHLLVVESTSETSDVESFTVAVPGAAGGGSLTVTLRGFSNTTAGWDHRVRVSLNDSVLGEEIWDGIGWHSVTFDVPEGVLLEGDNTIEVTALLNGGVPYSSIGVDSFDLTYERRYEAAGDQLICRGDGNREVLLGGFSSPQIMLFDISNPKTPKRVSLSLTGGESGSGWVRFRPAGSEIPYLASTAAGAFVPAFLESVVPQNIKNRRYGLNYLIITAPELREAAEQLAAFHRGRGLKPTVVTTEDIYNDFSWGMPTPHAIRAFIRHAALKWKPAPRYVLFAGDGSYDYKDSLGYGECLVPPLMTTSPWGITPSDGLFVDVYGEDGVPDLAFGRIPARTAAELTDYIAKLSRMPNPSTRAIFVADNPDAGGNFPQDSDEMSLLVPGDLTVEKIHLSTLTPLADVRSRLLASLNEGALFLNYLGHAGYTNLTSESILTVNDIPLLTNGHALPIVTGWTCLVGQFALPGSVTIGEKLVQGQDAGAIAVFGPTITALNDDSRRLGAEFWKALSSGSADTLGDLVLDAVRNYSAGGGADYAVRAYTLLGDPAIEVK